MTERREAFKKLSSPRAGTRRRAVEALCRMSRSSKSILEVMEITLLPLAVAISRDSESEVLIAGCRAIAKSFSDQLMRNPDLIQMILEHVPNETEFAATLVSALHDAQHDPLRDNLTFEVREQLARLAELIPKPKAEVAPLCEFWRSVLALHPLLRADGRIDEKSISHQNFKDSPVLRPWSQLIPFLKMNDKGLLRKLIQVRSALLCLDLPVAKLKSLAADEHPFTNLRIAINTNCPETLRSDIFADILALHRAAGDTQKDALWFAPLSSFELWKEINPNGTLVTFSPNADPKVVWLHFNTGFITFYEETSLRERLRSCPGLPAELGEYLRVDPTGGIRDNIVRKHNKEWRFAGLAMFSNDWSKFSPEDKQRALALLSFDTNIAIRELVAKNAHDTHTLRRLSTDFEVSVRACVAPRIQDMRAVYSLSHDKSLRVRLALATRNDCPKELLKELVDKNGERARLIVAKNEACPEELLCTLASDASHAVRNAVAARFFLPASVIEILANDELNDIRLLMLKQKNADEKSLQKVVACATAVDLKYSMPPYGQLSSVAERVMRFCHHALIRGEYARNPETTTDDLARYAQDPDDEVRIAVAYNPSSTPAVLELLYNDDNSNVKSMAKKRLEKKQRQSD